MMTYMEGTFRKARIGEFVEKKGSKDWRVCREEGKQGSASVSRRREARIDEFCREEWITMMSDVARSDADECHEI
jgi:hypothetical protein